MESGKRGWGSGYNPTVENDPNRYYDLVALHVGKQATYSIFKSMANAKEVV
jgi:hypothetical protein